MLLFKGKKVLILSLFLILMIMVTAVKIIGYEKTAEIEAQVEELLEERNIIYTSIDVYPEDNSVVLKELTMEDEDAIYNISEVVFQGEELYYDNFELKTGKHLDTLLKFKGIEIKDKNEGIDLFIEEIKVAYEGVIVSDLEKYFTDIDQKFDQENNLEVLNTIYRKMLEYDQFFNITVSNLDVDIENEFDFTINSFAFEMDYEKESNFYKSKLIVDDILVDLDFNQNVYLGQIGFDYSGKLDPDKMDFNSFDFNNDIFEMEESKSYNEVEILQPDMENLLETAEKSFEAIINPDFNFFIKDLIINTEPIFALNMGELSFNFYEEEKDIISNLKVDDMLLSIHFFLEEFSIKSSTTTQRINREDFIRFHLDPVYFSDFSVDYEITEFKLGLDPFMAHQLAVVLYETYEIRPNINEMLSIDELRYALNYEDDNILFDFDMKHPFLKLHTFSDIILTDDYSEPEPFSDEMIFFQNLLEAIYIEDFLIEGTYLNKDMKLLLIELENYLDRKFSKSFEWKDDRVIWDYSGLLSEIFEEEEEQEIGLRSL